MADRTTRLLLDDTDIKRNLAEITARVDQLAKSFNGVASSFAAAVNSVSTQNKFVQGVQAQSQFLKTGLAPDASSDRASDLASSQAAATVRVAEAQKLVNDQIAKRGVASQTALKALDTEQAGYNAIVDKLKSINLETSARISLNTRLKLQQDEQFASTTKQLATLQALQRQDLQQSLLNNSVFQNNARDGRLGSLNNRVGDQEDERFQAANRTLAVGRARTSIDNANDPELQGLKAINSEITARLSLQNRLKLQQDEQFAETTKQLSIIQAQQRQDLQLSLLSDSAFQNTARDIRVQNLNNRVGDQQDERVQAAQRQLTVGRAQTSLGNAQDPELIALKAQKDVLTQIASLEAQIEKSRSTSQLATDAGDKLKAFQENLKQARLEVELAQAQVKAGTGTADNVASSQDAYTRLYQIGESVKETAAYAKQVQAAEEAIAATAAKLAVEQEKGNAAAVSRLEMKKAEQALDLIALTDITRTSAEYADQLAIVKQLAAAQAAANSPQAKDAARIAELNRQASSQYDDVRNAQASLNRVNSKNQALGDGGAFLLQLQAQFSVNNAVLNTFQSIVSSVTTYVTTLDKSLYDLKAIAGLTNSELSSLSSTLVKVSESSKFTSVDLAKSATDLAQAGFSGKQIEESIGGIAQLATATGSELAKTTDVVSTTLNIFNLRATDTQNVVNTLTTALNLTKLDLERLGLGLQYAGEAAANSGIGFEELTASIGAFANAGARSGSTIGTGLRSLITELAAPTAKLQTEFDRLGISTEDINLKSQGLTGVLQNLSDKGFVASAAFEALDRRSVNAFLSISSQLGTINDLTKAFSFSTAAADGAADANESLANKLNRTTGIFGNLATSLLEGPLKTFKQFIDLLGQVGIALNGSGVGFRLIGDLLTALPIAGVGAVLFNLARGFVAAGTAAEGAAVGVGILNVALRANPFTIILAALTAGIALFSEFGGAADAAADRLEKTKGRVSAAADALAETRQTAQGIAEAMANLSNRTTVLEKDSDLLQATIDGLNNKFGSLGLNLDRNETRVLNVVNALGKLKAGFDALAVDNVQASISAQVAQQAEGRQISLKAPGSKNFGPGLGPTGVYDSRTSLGLTTNAPEPGPDSVSLFQGKVTGFPGDAGFNSIIQQANNPSGFDVANENAASGRLQDLNGAIKASNDSLAQLADGLGIFAKYNDEQRVQLADIIKEAQGVSQAQIDRINLYRKQAATIKASGDILPDLEFQKANSETATALLANFKQQHEDLDKQLAALPPTDLDGREKILGQLKDTVADLNQKVTDTFGLSIVELQKKFRGATLTTDFAQAQGEVNAEVQSAQDAIDKNLLVLLGLSVKRYETQISKIKEETSDKTPVGLIPDRQAQALSSFDSEAANERQKADIELRRGGNFPKQNPSDPDGIYEKSLQAVDTTTADARQKISDYFDKVTKEAIDKDLLSLLGLNIKQYETQISKIREETNNKTPIGLIPGRESQALSAFDRQAADERQKAEIELRRNGNLPKQSATDPDGIYEKSLQAVDATASDARAKIKDYFEKIVTNIKETADDLKSGVRSLALELKGVVDKAKIGVKAADDEYSAFQTELKDVSRPEYVNKYGSSREIALKLQQPAAETKRNNAVIDAEQPVVDTTTATKNELLQQQTDLQARLLDLQTQIANANTSDVNSVQSINRLKSEEKATSAELQTISTNLQTADTDRADAQEKINAAKLRQKQIDEDRSGQTSDLDVSKSFTDAVNDYKQKTHELRSPTQELANDLTQVFTSTQSAFSSFLDKIVTGTASVKDAFKSLATDILKSMLTILENKASQQLVNLLLNLGLSAIGGGTPGIGGSSGVSEASIAQGAALYQGGIIRAAQGYVPSPNRDSVNILAQPGEAVLRKSAVDLLGHDTVNSLNALGNNLVSGNDTTSGSSSSSQTPAVVNVYVVPDKDSVPALGQNDVLAVVQRDIATNGTTARLIKSITVGDAT